MPNPSQSYTPSVPRPTLPQRPLLAKPRVSTNGLPAGITNTAGGVTREVQGNELTSTNMERLGNSNNRILNQARMRGAQSAASRGGINSNLAAAGAEGAYLDMAGNVASQDASAYRDAAGQNLESLKQQRIASEGNETQLGAAGISASASMYNSDNSLLSSREARGLERDLTLSGREFTAGESRLGREFTAGESALDRGFRSSESERDRDFTRGRDRTLFEQDQEGRDNEIDRTVALELMQRFVDNPEEFDEYNITGAANFFNRFLNPRRRTGP